MRDSQIPAHFEWLREEILILLLLKGLNQFSPHTNKGFSLSLEPDKMFG